MQNRWSQQETRELSPLDLLVYQSRLIGAEEKLVLFGGGNTSIKRKVKDFRGREVQALTVKGSGSDMKVAAPQHFSDLRLEDIFPLLDREAMSDEEMVAYLAYCLVEPSAPRPSIETLLHGFLPFTSIVHTHADVILSLTNNGLGAEAVRNALGSEIVSVPYRRPGFLNSKDSAMAVQETPDATGLVLLNHGLITWGDDAEQAFARHIDLVSRAEDYIADRGRGKTVFVVPETGRINEATRREVAVQIAPVLRGAASRERRIIAQYDDSPAVLEFVDSTEARTLSQQGPATPDHMLRTRRLPLWIEVTDPSDADALSDAIAERLVTYADEYLRWFDAHTDGQIQPLDPYPRVVLVKGIGMWTLGKDARSARMAQTIYHHTIDVIRGAQVISAYQSLSPQDAFDVDHWPLELYKLTLAPPERELARRVALVTGAASGIGAAIAERLAGEGAHVILTDVDITGARQTTERINAGEGDQRCVAFPLNVTDEAETRRALEHTSLALGGLDILVSNAGIAPSSPIDELSLSDWEKSFAINSTGHFLIAREAVRLMKRQGIGGSLVFIATKNVPAPGRGFGAYSAAKAAEAQLGRILALEGGPFGIRSNMINPDAVFEGSQLWSAKVKEERAQAHGVPLDKLEEFYQQRNLLKAQITPDDVAETALFLASDRSAKTTGAMLPVDGGVAEAFPR